MTTLTEQTVLTGERVRHAKLLWISGAYGRYLLVGGFVGAISIAGRELVGALLPGDTRFYYGISVITVYALCIVLSFALHRVITFRGTPCGIGWRDLIHFVLIAAFSAGCTGIVAVAMRYAPGFERIFAPYSAMAAFIAAAILVSALSFSLNAKYVFSPGNHPER